MTLAHLLSKLLPSPLVRLIRPKWHFIRLLFSFYVKGGRLRYNREIGNIELSMFLPEQRNKGRLKVIVRSIRELRRWIAYVTLKKPDKVYTWLSKAKNCEVLWDVGSANGIEGFTANHLTNCKVTFIEPFTPSIETILKTAHVQDKVNDYEVVHAACSDNDEFIGMVNHTIPKPGETFNSIDKHSDEYCQGGRSSMDKVSKQWVSSITLDSLHFKHNLEIPSHVKIDVDGLEMRVLMGAKKIFDTGKIKACVVEVNDSNPLPVIKFLETYGYSKVDEYVHADIGDKYTADYFFERLE